MSKNVWIIPPLPQHTLMAWCSVKVQGQLYLYRLPGKPRRGWGNDDDDGGDDDDDNEFNGIGNVDWNNLAQDRIQW
jgi:hypothetical protein